MSVLYAEDDPANRRLMEIRLKRRGIHCTSFENGRDALDAFLQNHFSVVILDLDMPGMTGLEVVRAIRKTDQKTPVFALTSDDTRISEQKDAGFTDVWIKPLQGEEYLDRISSCLPQGSES